MEMFGKQKAAGSNAIIVQTRTNKCFVARSEGLEPTTP